MYLSDFNKIIDSNFIFEKQIRADDKKEILLFCHKLTKQYIIKKTFSGSAEVYEMLIHISHKNLPKVYDIQYGNGYVTIYEEYIDGITVADVIKDGLYNENGVKMIILSLCNVLEVLHNMNIIHRDIKPENIVIDKSGTVKLIDFDSSRIYKPFSGGDTKMLGTPGYAAPEQFGIKQSDFRTDIYALGILINVMLTGTHPADFLYRGKYKKIIEKCTMTNPEHRFQSIKQLHKKIEKM